MAKAVKHKGISRIDTSSTHGWYVRVYQGGKTKSRLFSDRKCGGKDVALQLAIAHRDRLLSENSSTAQKHIGERFDDDRSPAAGIAVVRRVSGLVTGKASVPGPLKHYLKTRPECKVTFVLPLEAAPTAETVHLLGDFNGWDGAATKLMPSKKDGFYSVTLKLPTGREYQYRYLIDYRQWENDWAADKYVPTEYGVENSVVVI